MHRRAGFTLIELLIVVAIIAILAAIAVPNFLEAQVRSKVSRSMADMRTIATALESYAADHTWYPLMGRVSVDDEVEYPLTQSPHGDKIRYIGPGLTTPIAYLASIPTDPFMQHFEGPKPVVTGYRYDSPRHLLSIGHPPLDTSIQRFGWWRLAGGGPDGDRKDLSADPPVVYDPTNGTVSDGDIHRSQKHSNNLLPMSS